MILAKPRKLILKAGLKGVSSALTNVTDDHDADINGADPDHSVAIWINPSQNVATRILTRKILFNDAV